MTTALPHHGVELEWDQGYVDGQRHCQEVIDEVDRKRIPVPFPKRRGQRPGDDLPNVFEMVRSLLALDPAAAAVLIDQISISTNVSRSQVVAELLAAADRGDPAAFERFGGPARGGTVLGSGSCLAREPFRPGGRWAVSFRGA